MTPAPTTSLKSSPAPGSAKGLRQFLTPEQQNAWLDGETTLEDADERSESLEQRFKYAARFEKLLRRPEARDVLNILRLYAERCIPIPRTTERYYWSVSCLPGSPDQPLARVNASWMEFFTLHADGDDGIRARFILHLSDFTTGGSPEPDHLDHALLESCVEHAEACPERSLSRARRGGRRNVSHFFWKADTFGVKVRTAASIRAFLTHPHGSRAIRRFNLTHMNRGRNAYQASHCYNVADYMLGEECR